MPNLPVPAAPRTSLSLAATLAALAFAPFVDGAVVLSNHSAVTSGSPSSFNVYAGSGGFPGSGEAVKVTTGAGSGWSVSSVSILGGYVSASWAFQIWTDNAGNLGTLVGTSATLTDAYSSGAKTFTFTSPVTLSGGASYWFTPAPDPATAFRSDLNWTYNSSATPTPSAAGWLQGSQLSTTDFTTWSASSGRSYASLEIDATSASSSGVPDGTSTALMLLPGAGLLALRFRRRTAGA